MRILLLVLLLTAVSLTASVVGWFLQPSIVLRTWVVYREGKPVRGDRIREWRLNIPGDLPLMRWRTFSNPAYDPARRPPDHGGQRISANTAYLDRNDLIVPWLDGGVASFAFTLDNKPLKKPELAEEPYCLTAAEYGGYSGNINTRIYLNYHGWNARVVVANDGLYRDPKKACRILRSALDRWTLSVDDLAQR